MEQSVKLIQFLKKRVHVYTLFFLLFFSVIPLLAQLTQGNCYTESGSTYLPANPSGTYESKNGYILAPYGTIRVLCVFAEIEYDVGTDPNPNSTSGWTVGDYPVWADDLFDPNIPTGPFNGIITEYYHEASFSEFIVLGDYLQTPNDNIFRVKMSDIETYGSEDALETKISEVMTNGFETGNGFTSVSQFDYWSITEQGKPKITPSTDSPIKIDNVIVIWRNREGYNGSGNVNPFGSINILGNSSDTHINVGSFNSIPTKVIRHEFAHLLLGKNELHCAGAGLSGESNYWIPPTGGYSIMGLYGSSLLGWNAWDRQRLNWTAPGNIYNPSVHDAQNNQEVDGDLDATNPSDAGIYTLRDFNTTGDAIRIKLPFTDPVEEFPEFLWLENHTGTENNNSPFDQWQYEESAQCVEPLVPGLLINLQIDKDIRIANNASDVFLRPSDYFRPLTADGFHDREFESTTIYNDCVQNLDTYAFSEVLSNPLTGGCDQDKYTINLDGNNIVSTDFLDNQVEKNGANYFKHLYSLGNSSHVFTLAGNKKIGISTNPSTASKMNLQGFNIPEDIFNLRKVYLNGISVEILSCDTNLNLQVNVRFDDVDVDQNVRWCADEIVLSPVSTTSGYSLNLKSGKTILLDHGTTATRMDNPVLFNGQEIFVSPTLFRCTANTVFNMEANSILELDNASTLRLEPNSILDVGAGSIVDLKNASKIVVQNNATLTFKSGTFLNLLDNCELLIEPGGNLIFENNVTISGNSTDMITIDGDLQIGTGVTFQKNGSTGYFYGLVLKDYFLETDLNLVTFNEAQLHNYGAELNITNSNFINSYIIYSHRGDITVSNSVFDRTWLYIENIEPAQSFTATISDNNFSTNYTMVAIDLWNYDNFYMQDNIIDGYYNGIQLSQSGGGLPNSQSISGNEIYNCTMSGIHVFNSLATLASNHIHDNEYGLRLYDNSSIALVGNPGAQDYTEMNYITDNSDYELYASAGSFPWYFRFNAIIDEDNIGNPTDPMVYAESPGGSILFDVKYNCWTEYNNFSPLVDLYPSNYLVYPTYCPPVGGHKSTELALEDFQEGLEQFENEEYEDAKTTFESVIESYPETQYSSASMKELLELEKFLESDYSALQTYYETNDSIQADSVLSKLAIFLGNKCEIEMENWQTAIDHFEYVIENPDTPEDSIFAIIDLGYTYFLMDTSESRSIVQGRMLEHKPTSFESFAEKRDSLLALLPFDKKNELQENALESQKAGELLQNVPNPFSNLTTIFYNLKNPAHIQFRIFDNMGKEVIRINAETQKKGQNNIEIDMKGFPKGMYLYSIYVNGQIADTKKMIVK